MSTKTSTKTVSPTRLSNAGLTTLVKEVTAFLDKAEPRLGPEAPSITSSDKRRTAKPRKGAEKLLTQLAPIVAQQGLDSSSLSSETMTSRLQDAQTLQPLQARLGKISKRVDDELFSAQGDAWAMGLQFYSLLRTRAKTDGTVAQSIEPLKAVFAYRHGSVKAAKASKVQTRAKAKLKDALALATRHDVSVGDSAQVAASPAAPTAPSGTGGTSSVVQSAPTPAPVPAPVASAQSGTAAAPLSATHVVITAAAPVAAPVATPPASGAPVAAASGATPAAPPSGSQ
jgi:hypothetical protein